MPSLQDRLRNQHWEPWLSCWGQSGTLIGGVETGRWRLCSASAHWKVEGRTQRDIDEANSCSWCGGSGMQKEYRYAGSIHFFD